MDERIETNRAWWNERVPLHVGSGFYDVDGFRRGGERLDATERAELGDVAGLRIAHLQCHFGLSTLTLARMGAIVTGIDFSRPAVEHARALAVECGLEARFVESNVYEVPADLDGTFDLVFASYGVLAWLPDLPGWMRVAARLLRPGGRLHLIDFHPFAQVFDDQDPSRLRVIRGYFHDPDGGRFDSAGSYVNYDAPTRANVTHEWTHGVEDILGGALGAGLAIESFRELPHTCYRMIESMIESESRVWVLPPEFPRLPLTFALRARRSE